jgi:glycyl-tRNA synthetase
LSDVADPLRRWRPRDHDFDALESPTTVPTDRTDALVSLAKRRGFVFPSGEIYGGTRSAWDYGPLGVELKENIRRQWWRSMVQSRDDIVGLDSSIILPTPVWQASGHVEAFVDPLTECTSCHRRWRSDQLEETYQAKHGRMPEPGLVDVPCPNCGTKGAFTEPRMFNGLLRTHLGPVETDEGLHYLRPETAQGIFVNFANVMTASRMKPPFGIAQTGKSFRNEITPGNFIFRTREFEQMEMEFFVEPGTDEEWHEYWLATRWDWYVDLGLDEADMRLFEHPKDKLSHYSKRTVDIEYRFGFGGSDFAELEGIANRTDFDLSTHAEHSGHDLSYFDQEKGERWTPYVIEPAAGLSRSVLAFLLDAYDVDEAPNTKGGVDKRTVMRFDPRLAPVKAAVLPLSRNEKLSPKAKDLAAELRRYWTVDFDDAGAIGRRYRRQDEIGTPFCVTVDFDTLDDDAVTVRDRDTMAQQRVALAQVRGWLAERIPGG